MSSEIKTVIEWDPSRSLEFFQSAYLTNSGTEVKRNLKILKLNTGEVYFETNSDGFKGPELDRSKNLVAVWGDSVIFGLGKGWINDLNGYFENFHFANGGIEGVSFRTILRRIADYNKRISFDHNIIFPGWHSLKEPRLIRQGLIALAHEIPGCIFCTVPISFDENVIAEGLDKYFFGNLNFMTAQEEESVYGFWGSLPYSIKNANKLLLRVNKMNRIIRKTAKQYNIQLIDLADEYKANHKEDFRKNFIDAGHFRPSAYSNIVKFLVKELKKIL